MESVKVLIVEDEEPIRELIAVNVEMLGYEPLMASTGREGIELFSSHKPHLVLLDLMLPDVEGYEVCRTIRMQDENVPIIFISARGEDFDKIIALELGADDYIVKPFNPRELQAKMKNWVKRYKRLRERESTDNYRRLGDVYIDLVNNVLRNAATGEEYKLTKGQLKLLLYLMSNPNRLVSFEELSSEFPQLSYETLRKYLNLLKGKIGHDKLLVVRGIGVRLRMDVEDML